MVFGELIPQKGDILQVRKDRKVIIANYKLDSLKNQFRSPALIKGILDKNDETGFSIKRNSILIVNDVVTSGFSEMPIAVWCRIAFCDCNIPQCEKALYMLNNHKMNNY